jgi:quinol monooxygenase YgiN
MHLITIVAKLQANAGKEDELREVLTEMIENVKTHEASGVPVYSLHVADNDPTLFLFYEQYASAEALEAHGKTDHMRAMGSKLGGLLAGRPVIERYTQIAGLK